MALACLSANAQTTFTIGSAKYTTTSPTTVQLTKYTADDEAVEVPKTVENEGTTYTVTSIGEEAFKWRSKTTSLTLPETIDSIYRSAFSSMSKLTAITLPSNLSYIGDYAFNSTGLTSIEIPASVKYIGGSAFFTAKSLASIKLNEGLEECGTSVFYKTALTDVTLPASLKKVPAKMFMECSKLTSVTIPDNYDAIGYGAFYNCAQLASISIPSGVKNIGDEAFYGCKALTSIALPASLDTLGTSIIAMSGVSTITLDSSNKSFKLVSGVLYSKNGKLLYAIPMTGVTSVSVKSGCIGINGGAFWGSAIESVTLPKGFLAIDDYAFCKSSLKSINFPSSLIYAGEQAFAGTKLSGTVTLPENMAVLQDGVFASCTDITAVEIPSGVKYIYPHAFHNCSKLASVKCLGTTPAEFVDIYEDYENPFYSIAASTVYVPKGTSSDYKGADWNYYFDKIVESDDSVMTYVSTNPESGSTYSKKYATMTFDVTFGEDITIVKKTPECYLRVGNAASDKENALWSGSTIEPDDCWNATTGSNKQTLRIWASDYDGYTMDFATAANKVYCMVIPAGVVKNAAGCTNEQIVIYVYGNGYTTDIDTTATDGTTATETARYSINGQAVGKAYKGIAIIKMSDGTTKKVLVK